MTAFFVSIILSNSTPVYPNPANPHPKPVCDLACQRYVYQGWRPSHGNRMGPRK